MRFYVYAVLKMLEELVLANTLFATSVVYPEPITYRRIKETDYFVVNARRVNFSYYAIAHGSSLFQRLLFRSANMRHLVSLEGKNFQDYMVSQGSSSCTADIMFHIILEVYMRMSCCVKVLHLLPYIILNACISIAAKFLDDSLSIPHDLTYVLFKRLERECDRQVKGRCSELAVKLEVAIMQQLDWNVCPVVSEYEGDISELLKHVVSILF